MSEARHIKYDWASARGILGHARFRWPYYNKQATGDALTAPDKLSEPEESADPDPIWRRDVEPGDSEAGKSGSGPWLSNGTYPAQSGRDAKTADHDHRPDVPTPADRISGIIDKYGDRVFTPISETHGRKLREECLSEPETVERTVQTGDNTEKVVSETAARGAVPWIAAISEMLEWYEGYRDKSLRMARGSERRGDKEAFLVDMDNSLTPAYQSRQYARLNGLKRQLLGGEYPNGETVDGQYAEPVTVLFSLTSSSTTDDGRHRPVVDHDREIREAWVGSSNSVKRTLRYVLEDKLGLESGDYSWWWQSEPHPGPNKAATAYSHSHPVVVFDRDAAAATEAATDPETYRAVVAKHVAECEGAGWSAHGLEDAVSVRGPDEIDDFASYVSEYLSVAPDDDLLERSDEYLMWAAAQWSTTTQKYSRSHWATAAVKADRCEQEAMDPETTQTDRHGETVVRSAAGSPHRFECAECGSPHGIDQSEDSLAAHRLETPARPSEARPSSTAATDGGEVADDDADGRAASASSVADCTEYGRWRASVEAEGGSVMARWSSARSVGAIQSEPVARRCSHTEPDACPLCATETEAPDHTVPADVPIPETAEGPPGEVEVVGCDRPPEWRPEAVVQTWSEEETVIGSPGGTAYGTVVVEGTESALSNSVLEYLPRPESVAGPEPWRETELFTESDVRLGLVPPPEMVAREVAEHMQTGRRVTPKRWSSTWYADRFGDDADRGDRAESIDELGDDAPPVDVAAVRELVRCGTTSVPSVLGELQIDPAHREAVADVVAECR